MEFFIKNLCKEIIAECNLKELESNSDFVLYYLHLLALDPLWNLHPDMMEIVRTDALHLIQFVVAKMKYQTCPSIVTLKLQMYFNCNFESEEVIVDRERSNYEKRLVPLVDEICSTSINGCSQDEQALFRKKIIYYISLLRGLGNPTEYNVFREIRQVLSSIYDDEDLLAFVDKTREIKEEELVQIAQVCCGIVVYNWHCKKGGFGIENLPQVCKDMLSKIQEVTHKCLLNTMEKINYLTTTVDYAFRITETEVKNDDDEEELMIQYGVVCMLPIGFEFHDMEYTKDCIILYRQLEVLLRRLIKELDSLRLYIFELDSKLEETINNFNNFAEFKVGVPREVVFPHFVELNYTWEDYQNVIIELVKLEDIRKNLRLYTREMTLNMQFINSVIEFKPILTDADRLDADLEATFEPKNDVIVLKDEMAEDKYSIKFEFLGFCAWKLVETQGGLIPGNPNMSMFLYKSKYYVFSCPAAAEVFLQNPHRLINEVYELCRKKVDLIPLLQMTEELTKLQAIKTLVVEVKKVEEKHQQQHIAIQTDAHPTSMNIDDKYMWNIWDWKRQAICLANISGCLTKSSQTDSSSNQNAIATQTYDPREKETQTMVENYSNVPRPLTYFFGLRGRKDDKQFVLDLTCPVEKTVCPDKETL